jgi:hypothetical protein
MNIAVSTEALMRAAYNALLYAPKKVPWCMAYVTLTPEGVSFVTSDSYSLAWCVVPWEDAPTGVMGATIKIDRESLVQLEERSRKDKADHIDHVILVFEPDEHLGYKGADPEKDVYWPDIFDDGNGLDDGNETWDEYNLRAFRQLIEEREEDPETRRVILNTSYLRKLGQLKKEDKDMGADLCFALPDETVLVKVGDFFRLTIEPIERERHEEALGEGATW